MNSIFLQHGTGQERANHKYKAREWVNGKWQYIYDEVTGVNDRKKANQLREQASGLDKTKDAYVRSTSHLGKWQVDQRVDNATEAERLRRQARNLETKAANKNAKIHNAKNAISKLSPSNIKNEITGANDRKKAELLDLASDMHFDRAVKAEKVKNNLNKYDPNHSYKQWANEYDHINNEIKAANRSGSRSYNAMKKAVKKENTVGAIKNLSSTVKKVNSDAKEKTTAAKSNLKKTKKENNAVSRAKKVLDELSKSYKNVPDEMNKMRNKKYANKKK